MKIWFYCSNQPVPQSNFNPRPGRMRILAEGLAKLGHNVTFWTSSFDHANRKHQYEMAGKQFDVKYKVVKSIGYKKNISIRRKIDYQYAAFLLYKKSCATINKNTGEQPDIIFVNWPSLEITHSAIKLGRKFKIPVIIGVSDLWPDNWLSSIPNVAKEIGKFYISFVRLKASKIMAQADAITGLTQEYLDWSTNLASNYEGRGFVLPMTYEDPGEEVNSEKKEFSIAFAGTFNHQFDFDWVYQLAEFLMKEESSINFLLAGDGDSRKAIQTKFKTLSNVKFLGFLDQSDLKKLLREASLGIAPYKNTTHFKMNLPNKPIEYLANGLPIICPIEGCIMSLIKGNKVGVSAYSMSIKELGNHIIYLKNNPLALEEFKINARETYLNMFHPKKIVRELEGEMYSLILNYKGDKITVKAH